MGLLRQPTSDITKGVIWKQLLAFFFPLWFGTFFQQLYNTVDTLVVGRFVGKVALAAVGSTSVIVNLTVGIFTGLAAGAVVAIAQHFGARRWDEVHECVHTAMLLSILIGAFFMVTGFVLTPWALRAMGTTEEALPGAILYLRVYFLGMVPNVIYNMGTGVLRAIGDFRRPLYFLMAASLCNIVLDLLFVGVLMVMAINPPLGRFNAWLSIQLDGMQGGSRLVLGTLLGGMMATDYGGPINKAAYVSGTLALVDQQYDLMAAVMAGGMIPPLGIGLACLLFPTRFTSTERCSAPQTLLMGATFVTEGALPFALRDPLRVSLACIAGSALAGFITILLGCGCPAPHGGLFLLPVMENPLGFLIALAVGTLTTALLLGMLKKPLKH